VALAVVDQAIPRPGPNALLPGFLWPGFFYTRSIEKDNDKMNRILRYALYHAYPIIPKSIRWKIAHSNHVNWKFRMLEKHGEKDYYDLYDKLAEHQLKNIFGLGLDFSDKTVVDIGCGLRGILGIIKAEKKIGIDPSINDKVREAFNLPEDIIFMCEKVENLSLEDDQADLIFCLNTLNHVEDPVKALAEIKRILKKNGLFFLDVYLNQRGLGHTHVLNYRRIKNLLKDFNPIKTHLIRSHYDPLIGEFVPQSYGGIFN